MPKKQQKQSVNVSGLSNMISLCIHLFHLATRLKIYNATDLSISGEDLDHMSAADIHRLVSQASIFYRVSPKHKLTIVKVKMSTM